MKSAYSVKKWFVQFGTRVAFALHKDQRSAIGLRVIGWPFKIGGGFMKFDFSHRLSCCPTDHFCLPDVVSNVEKRPQVSPSKSGWQSRAMNKLYLALMLTFCVGSAPLLVGPSPGDYWRGRLCLQQN